MNDPNPIYDPMNAINWVLADAGPTWLEAGQFLTGWREGNLAEWPDYVAWVGALA